jgi:hypothetical protein
MLNKLRLLPLFPGATTVDPTIREVTFGDFEARLRGVFHHECECEWRETKSTLPASIRDAVREDEALQFLTWWLKVKFDRTKNCNVRPYYLPGFSGRTKDLRGYRISIERIRAIAMTVSDENGLDGVDDLKLRRLSALSFRGGRKMRGRVFDIDAHVLLLLFESMSGPPKARLGDLAIAFGKGTAKDVDKIRKRIAAAKKHLRRHLRKIDREKRTSSFHR